MSSRLIAAVLLLAGAAPAAAKLPSDVFVFGDSLVDAGNLNVLFGTNVFNPPARGYFPGRFTNGPDYTDLLNQRLYGSLSTPSLLGGNNFGFGGARAVDHGDAIPDLDAQLGSYFARSGNTADPNALYILNFGGNDVFGLQSGMIGGYADAATYSAAVVSTIVGGVQMLNARGAGRILVTGIPNPTPTGFALEAALQAQLDAIEPGLGNTDLLRFSYIDFFIAAATDPSQFGIGPFTQTGNCRDSRVAVNGQIDCTGFSSFDGIHPTAEVQAAVYRQVAALTSIGAVPEPGTWLLMIAGFGLVGTTLRRRVASKAV